jgi:cysteine synthase A
VVLDDVTQAVGNTPLVRLSRIAAGLEGNLLAKLEFLNPGLSKKDRVARQMIDDALASGDLVPGQAVVELTSGNTGTGLALVCAVRGHPFVAVMSKGNSVERARMMRALGAEVVLVDQAPGSVAGSVSGSDLQLVEEAAQAISRSRGAFRADQFNLPSNVRAHELHTGREILAAADGGVDAFLDFAGSAGSFTGVARALKAANPATRCYLLEPAGAAHLAGQPVTRPGHRVQGGGYSRDLPLLQKDLVDGWLQVEDAQAAECARRLAAIEGLFCGFSSGAVVSAALELLAGPERGATIVVLLADSGLKYLSTDLYP